MLERLHACIAIREDVGDWFRAKRNAEVLNTVDNDTTTSTKPRKPELPKTLHISMRTNSITIDKDKAGLKQRRRQTVKVGKSQGQKRPDRASAAAEAGSAAQGQQK